MVRGDERGELSERLIGTVALGRQHDPIAAASVETEHEQDAPRVDGIAACLRDLDRDACRAAA